MSNELSYGATRERLIANGYAPVSVLAPLEKRAYRIAEDLAGIACMPDDRARRVVSLIVTARDKSLRSAINGLIERHGLAAGPVRTGGDGSECRVLRFDDWEAFISRSWSPFDVPPGDDPAVAVEHADRSAPGQPMISASIRLDGAWKAGDLLTTPRAKLPAIDAEGIAKFIGELGGLVRPAPWVNPPLRERVLSDSELNRPRMAGPRSKRDLSGNPAVLAAHLEAVRRGEEVELPDRAPEDTEIAAPAPTAPRLLGIFHP